MGRAPCCDKNGLKKGPWTSEEDQKLIDYIRKHGYGNWRTLPKNAGLHRCGKSCRLRWTNYLRPDIKRGRFSFDEEETIIQLHSILGNKWSAIAARLPGRTDNEIKNYWNTHIRKRLLRMGIDPVTHSPRLDLLDLSSILNLNSALHASSQLSHMSRMLGAPSMLNPDLLSLASSLLSSQTQPNFGFLNPQHPQENEICYPQLHHNPSVQPTQIPQPSSVDDVPYSAPFQPQAEELQFPCNFGSDSFNAWEMAAGFLTGEEGYFPHPGNDNPTFVPTTSNVVNGTDEHQNFGFGSVNNLTSPSCLSSPTQVNSNSTYVNGCSTEDERESEGAEMFMKFEFPELLDVADIL